MNDKQAKGSKTAKDGFKNENFVIQCFNSWKDNQLGQSWLKEMQYNLNDIDYVQANKVKGSFKADVQVEIHITIKLKFLMDIQNLQVKWALKPINYILNHFGNGNIEITPRGSFKIGKITMQRKGGDGGRETANMLQFKINPCEIIDY